MNFRTRCDQYALSSESSDAASSESATINRLSRGVKPRLKRPASRPSGLPPSRLHPRTSPMRRRASANLPSSSTASWYARIAESRENRRSSCSPRRNAFSAGQDRVPIDGSRIWASGPIRPISRSTSAANESAKRSSRVAKSVRSSSASAFPVAASTTVTRTRAESAPAPTTCPDKTSCAPVRRPSSLADVGSAGPCQRRNTTVGETVRSGPAPSKLFDK